MKLPLIHHLVASLSVILSCGLTVHDAGVDHAYATALTRPHLVSYAEADQEIPQKPLSETRPEHAHADYNPLGDTLTKTFSYQSPSIAPRRHSHHKQLMRLLETGKRHAFDDAYMPVLA